MSINSLLMNYQDASTSPTAEKEPSQATVPYRLPSPANSHTPAQQYQEYMEPT